MWSFRKALRRRSLCFPWRIAFESSTSTKPKHQAAKHPPSCQEWAEVHLGSSYYSWTVSAWEANARKEPQRINKHTTWDRNATIRQVSLGPREEIQEHYTILFSYLLAQWNIHPNFSNSLLYQCTPRCVSIPSSWMAVAFYPWWPCLTIAVHPMQPLHNCLLTVMLGQISQCTISLTFWWTKSG